jgi:hypothetical protein
MVRAFPSEQVPSATDEEVGITKDMHWTIDTNGSKYKEIVARVKKDLWELKDKHYRKSNWASGLFSLALLPFRWLRVNSATDLIAQQVLLKRKKTSIS